MSEQYASVSTILKGLFRVAESPAVQLCTGPGIAGAAVREEYLQQARLPDALLRFLLDMDRKLDAILGQLHKDNLAQDFPHKARIVELSAAGGTLECVEPLAPGDFLELVLFLEDFPLRLASGIIRIEGASREKPRSGVDGAAFSFVFICLREEERESIIRFVFQEERRLIRQQKGE